MDLIFIEKLQRNLNILKNKGILAYEVGHDQASDVIQIMKENGFESIYTKCDLQGFERVVIGFYNN